MGRLGVEEDCIIFRFCVVGVGGGGRVEGYRVPVITFEAQSVVWSWSGYVVYVVWGVWFRFRFRLL